jgi:hypothetical protein
MRESPLHGVLVEAHTLPGAGLGRPPSQAWAKGITQGRR